MKNFLFILLVIPLFAFGQTSNETLKRSLKPVVKRAAYSDISKPLRDMKPIPGWYLFDKEKAKEEVPLYTLPFNNNPFANQENQNPHQQKNYSNSKASLILGTNVDGVEAADGYGVIPPDPYGDVGKTYYVQMVNNGTQIFNKSDGSTVLGPFDSSQFWDGFDGSWTGTNDGDPVVMYDEQADRWVVSQFAWDTDDDTNWELVAVSQTNDPTGSYYRFAFEFDNFPDYPKLGIFLDSYIFTVNSFASSFEGTYVCALDRNEMLDGPDGQDDPAMISFFDDVNNPSIASEFSFTWLPADIEGNLPAAGTDIPFVFDMADETYWNKDALVIATMHVDWDTPSNSTFTLDNEISITQDTDPGGDAPQPSNSNDGLDLLNDRMMSRAQFRHFDTYDAMVCTRTVDDGTGVAAIRWYELRNSGSGWDIYQQGTYAPGDGVWRWMPAIAMNGNGDIAIAYSTSDGVSVEPSMRAVARYAGDATGEMTTTETVLYGGNTSQDASDYTRWGDYFSLMVDPSDDYTFWFTGEYSDGDWDWVTRIIEFALESLDPPVITSVSPTTLFEDRGKEITIEGTGLTGCTFEIGGVVGTATSNDGETAVVSFPAGNYTDGTLTVENTAGNDTENVTVSTRNTIPVVAGASTTSDDHPTIQSAIDGLSAWYGTTAFSAGDLPGSKIITVASGTYSEEVTVSSTLVTDASNTLTIQNNSGELVTIDGAGNDYGFNLSTLDYITLTGFTIESANTANIYAQGNNVTISNNKAINSPSGSGIKVETGTPFTITNNLTYGNYKNGIYVNSSNNIVKNNTSDNNGGLVSPQSGVEIFNDPFETLDNWVAGNWGLWSGISGSDSGDPFAGVEGDGVDYQYITSNDIDISGYDNLTISCYYSDYGTLESSDDIIGDYSLDGGNTWTNFLSHSNDQDGFVQVSVSGIDPGGSTTLLIRFGADVDGSEYWLVDDVVVTGDETFAAYNEGNALYVESGTGTTVENNIFVAKSGSDDYYSLKTEAGATISSDYNTYYKNGNTNLVDYNGTVYLDLSAWAGNGAGANELENDPVFVNAGTDYHIQSTADAYAGGEWPATTATSGTWTTYASDSPAIDGGNTADGYANEPSENGSRINQGAYGNTIQASKSAAAAVAINWTGNSDSNWQNTGNWDSGTIPTSSDDVTIPSGAPNYPIINNGISTVALCNNLTIDAGGLVTIDPNGYMTVTGSIINNEGVAGLVINSDDTGTGSLIQNTSGGVDATVNRKLPSSGRQWHMVASPIDAAPLTVFSSSNNLYYYDESTDDYWTGADYDAGSTSGWTAASGNMGVAEGYVYNNFAETLTFTGQLNDNSSTSSISVVYTNNGGTAPNGSDYDDFDGWNFIGNPYTSAIDWDNAAVDHAGANLLDAVYCYDDETAHTYTSYVDGVGTNGGTQYIPAMQGFFVKGDDTETSGTLNIGSGALVHSDQAFWKSTYVTPQNLIRLEVSSNNLKDETVIRLTDNATFDMDNGLDAYKMFTLEDDVPQIYTNSNSNTEYSINSLKTIDDGSFSIPLKVAQTDGTFTINISEFTFSDIKVYIKDNLTSETVELGLGDILSFTTDASDAEDRFELIFEKGATNIIQAENANVTLYPNPNNGTFFLTVGKDVDSYEVCITNVTGQVVYKNIFNDGYTKELNLNSISNGIYFVKITFSDKSLVNKKIIIE